MTEIKELKINVPIPVKTRKGRKKTEQKQANAEPVKTKVLPYAESVKTKVLPYAESAKTPAPIKKPTISVPLPYSKSVQTPSPLKPLTPVKVIEKPVRKTMNAVKVNVQPIKRKNFTLKRKFTAKRITIQVENSNKIKKNRELIENTVKNMGLPEITERLRSKGLVRPTSNPPETMQRNMMIDIMVHF